MATEAAKAILDAIDFDTDDMTLDDFEQALQAKVELTLADLDLLKQERKLIRNRSHLGQTVLNTIWEQMLHQIPATAVNDFIEANGGLTLDLREEAHIQTVENFELQKYAAHNTYIDYAKRGEEYRSNFHTDPNDRPSPKQKQPQRYNAATEVWETYDNVDGTWKKALRKDYRIPYEKDREKDKKNKFGSKTINKDHQVADATIARDAQAGAYMTLDEKVAAANSKENLFDLDSAANQSKSDHDGEKWISHRRTGRKGKGQTNAEYYGIDQNEYIEQDQKAKDAWNEKKEEKKAENIALGKKSQKDEAFRIGGKALRTAFLTLLATLLKKIITKLIRWLKSTGKSLHSLIESIKMAIRSFVAELKTLLVDTTDSVLTMIFTSIVGPVIGTIKKTVSLLRQGWHTLKQAIQFLCAPENRGKPLSYLLPQVGIIVTSGLCSIGAAVLGEFIEKALLGIPFLAVDIPLLGSPANLIGMLMGAIVCGIIGAIAIDLINRLAEKQLKDNNLRQSRAKQNQVLALQQDLLSVQTARLSQTEQKTAQSISARHKEAAASIRASLENIMDPSVCEKQRRNNDELERLLHSL